MTGRSPLSATECYRLLGLPDRAPVESIKAAYRQLARRYHPDCNPDDRSAQEKFVALSAAYQRLLAGDAESVGLDSDLSSQDSQIKWQAHQQLQDLLGAGQLLRAVSLTDSLVRRFPQDVEVRQWQAIACHQYGRQLVRRKQYPQARVYLQKARRADPQNRSLLGAIARDLQQIQQHLR